MASFLSDIWATVLDGGTNSSLIIATHASFAALQLTLALLLFATRSWHFFFLSVICAGLWGAIVWFVQELEVVKAEEARRKKLEEEKEEEEAEKKAGEDGGDSTEAKAEEAKKEL